MPRVDVTTVARHSRAVTAGSMRGFGASQTMTALEVMIDEAAASLGQDPVAFRTTNLLKTGGKTMVGNVVSGAVRSGEVLERLAAQPVWTERAAEKVRRTAAAPNKAYGVGLACVSTVFGSGSDPAFALVEIDPAGRITVTSPAVEIGSGVATALAVRVADRLGVAADEVRLGVLDGWDVLGLVASDDPFTLTSAQQDEAAKNPRWVPDIAQDTTASISAHVHTTIAAEAANVILRFGLWPAARAIWSGPAAGEFLRFDDIRFVDGKLTAAGMEPLALPRLAAKAHAMGLVVAAMVHGYNRWSWARATFDLPDGRYEGAIDALAVKYGNGASPVRKAAMATHGYQRFDRVSVTFPPTLFERIGVGYTSAAGTGVAVEMHVLKSGCRWVDCPPEYGPAKTVYNRFNRWSAQGIWQSIFEAAAEPAEPPERMALDSTHVKAHRCAGGGKGGRRNRRLASPRAGATARFTALSISCAARGS